MTSDSIWEAVMGVRAIHIRDQSGRGATFCQFVTTERNKEKGGEALGCQHVSIREERVFSSCYVSKC